MGSRNPEKWLYLSGVAVMGLLMLFAIGWPAVVLAAVASALGSVGFLIARAARRGASALRAGKGRRPGTWLALGAATAPVALLGLLVSYAVGAFAGALDMRKACMVQQESYDAGYRQQHAGEMDHWFPLHNKCNADFDLVPGWVNPVVAICAGLVAAGVITAAVAAVAHIALRRKQRRCPPDLPRVDS
ncbi:hypothetical protein [Streptomyces iconiensis]|uniref:Integral membrane protein n=1 Tax=Streptomyces iconiensis TaxID=1384038 RepID=A0ABT7A676_9ACTN|nr:hypothetical protein [Streptomyces iconiensis]MDJ1136806.1 hypothetical protein [Streptomyces iconiensis]